MQIRASIALKAVIKSMVDVVLPAVDGDNQLAQEQGRLVVGLLTLIADRLPLQRAYDIDELRRLCDLGARLACNASNSPIALAVKRGEEALAGAMAGPDNLDEVLGALTAAIGDGIYTVALQNDESGRADRLAVLAAAREQQLRERSWLLMQRWEVDASSIPAIEDLLGRKPDSGAKA